MIFNTLLQLRGGRSLVLLQPNATLVQITRAPALRYAQTLAWAQLWASLWTCPPPARLGDFLVLGSMDCSEVECCASLFIFGIRKACPEETWRSCMLQATQLLGMEALGSLEETGT